MRANLVFRNAIDVASFEDFAQRRGWVFQGHHPPTESSPEEIVWATEKRVGVHLVDDEVLAITYLVLESESVSGATSHDVLRVYDAVAGSFGVIESHELVDLYFGAPEWNSKVLVLMMLAAAASSPSPMISSVIEDAFASEVSEVRRAAAIAAMYAPWDTLRGSVEHAARSDTDAETRELAEMALANFD
ncbi:hypothetical protein ACFWR4_30575 [Streptomyces hydrogenans]|uniref:hypothetical protein n=1 Tax=Streptomyces hydrogenans TaxID=1873719 RepID=UPI0036489C8B